jgi:hypothetical protein
MSFTKNMVVALSAVLLLYLYIGTVWGQPDEADAAAVALEQADAEVAGVFELLQDAEAMGADVSALRDALTEACGWLATAHAYQRSGNLSGALALAEQTAQRGEGLEAEALMLANSAALERGRRLSVTMAISVAGALLVPLVGLVGWRYVQAWYVRRVWKMKPEVRDVDEPA